MAFVSGDAQSITPSTAHDIFGTYAPDPILMKTAAENIPSLDLTNQRVERLETEIPLFEQGFNLDRSNEAMELLLFYKDWTSTCLRVSGARWEVLRGQSAFVNRSVRKFRSYSKEAILEGFVCPAPIPVPQSQCECPDVLASAPPSSAPLHLSQDTVGRISRKIVSLVGSNAYHVSLNSVGKTQLANAVTEALTSYQYPSDPLLQDVSRTLDTVVSSERSQEHSLLTLKQALGPLYKMMASTLYEVNNVQRDFKKAQNYWYSRNPLETVDYMLGTNSEEAKLNASFDFGYDLNGFSGEIK